MIKSILDDLVMSNPEVKLCLTMNLNRSFPCYVTRLSKILRIKTACCLAAKKLLHDALSLRKSNAGYFLKQVRNINALEINTKDDFGECFHTPNREPFFYETAYKHNFVKGQLAIDHTKRCIFRKNFVSCSDEYMSYNAPIAIDENSKAHTFKQLDDNRWECSHACRTLDSRDIDSIVEIKKSFDQPIEDVREELEMVDGGCPHLHHIKLQSEGDDMAVELLKLGHPQPCTVGTCQSKLQVLRAASVHYPVLRKLLENVYAARCCHNFVKS